MSTDILASARSDLPLDPDDKYSIFKTYEKSRSASITSVERRLSNSSNDSSLSISSRMQALSQPAIRNPSEQKGDESLENSQNTPDWGNFHSTAQTGISFPTSADASHREGLTGKFSIGAADTLTGAVVMKPAPVSESKTHENFGVFSNWSATSGTGTATSGAGTAISGAGTAISGAGTAISGAGTATSHYSAFSNTALSNPALGGFAEFAPITSDGKSANQLSGLPQNIMATNFESALQINAEEDDFGDFQTMQGSKPTATSNEQFTSIAFNALGGTDTVHQTMLGPSSTSTLHHTMSWPSSTGTLHQAVPGPSSAALQFPGPSSENPVTSALDDSWDDFAVFSATPNLDAGLTDSKSNTNSFMPSFATNTEANDAKKDTSDMFGGNYQDRLAISVATLSTSTEFDRQISIKSSQSSQNMDMFSSIAPVVPKSLSEPQLGTLSGFSRDEQFSDFAAFDSSSAKQRIDDSDQVNTDFSNFGSFSSFSSEQSKESWTSLHEPASKSSAENDLSLQVADLGNFESVKSISGHQAPESVFSGYQAPASVSSGYQAPASVSSGYQAPLESFGSFDNQFPLPNDREAPATSGYQAPASVSSGHQAPASVSSGYQAPAPVSSGYQVPASVSTGYQAPLESFGSFEKPFSLPNDREINTNPATQLGNFAATFNINEVGQETIDNKQTALPTERTKSNYTGGPPPALEAEDRYKALSGVLEVNEYVLLNLF